MEKAPADFVKSDGHMFWSGTKRFPMPITTFDPSDPFHVMFVMATANVLAAAFGLVPTPEGSLNLLSEHHEWRQHDVIASIVRSLPVPPITKVDIQLEDDTSAFCVRTVCSYVLHAGSLVFVVWC